MTDDSNDKDKKTDASGSVFSNFQDEVSDVSWRIFFIGFFCGLLTIGYHVFVWLKTGEWMDTPFYSVFIWLNIDPFTPVYNIGWQGIKKILLWFIGLPLSLMFMVLGAAIGGLFYSIFSIFHLLFSQISNKVYQYFRQALKRLWLMLH